MNLLDLLGPIFGEEEHKEWGGEVKDYQGKMTQMMERICRENGVSTAYLPSVPKESYAPRKSRGDIMDDAYLLLRKAGKFGDRRK